MDKMDKMNKQQPRTVLGSALSSLAIWLKPNLKSLSLTQNRRKARKKEKKKDKDKGF